MIEARARGSWQDLATRLRPFIARRVSSPAETDDVLQDVLLKMHRGIGDVADEERFGAWVYRVARNAIADHQRARARHPFRHLEEAPEEPAAHEEQEGDDAEEVLSEYMAYFVAALPSPYREAVTLVELEGMTQVDAARATGVSVSTMKSRVQRGRAKLREMLDACCRIALDARGRVIACEPRPYEPSRRAALARKP